MRGLLPPARTRREQRALGHEEALEGLAVAPLVVGQREDALHEEPGEEEDEEEPLLLAPPARQVRARLELA